jgi:hypothetical protein
MHQASSSPPISTGEKARELPHTSCAGPAYCTDPCHHLEALPAHAPEALTTQHKFRPCHTHITPEAIGTGSLASYGASSFINSNVYTGADSIACIQLWSRHEQCHQLSFLRGWGVVYLLYLLACALQYRYLNNITCCSGCSRGHTLRTSLHQAGPHTAYVNAPLL